MTSEMKNHMIKGVGNGIGIGTTNGVSSDGTETNKTKANGIVERWSALANDAMSNGRHAAE